MNKLILSISLLAASVFSLNACSESKKMTTVEVLAIPETETITLDVYKSPTCGCCGSWIEHLNKNAFSVNAHNTNELAAFKLEAGVSAQYQSCHTAVSADYVFEGHIPAKIIQKFLTEKPEGAIGLAVAGMPMGSPGMDMGNKFSPYQVLQLNADGSSKVYAQINSKQEQY